MKALLGKKIGMSQVFEEDGKVVPVTLIEAGPCWVTQIKTKKRDGYRAVQIGFVKRKNSPKSLKGKNFKYLKEFRIEKDQECDLKTGDKIEPSIFETGEKVKVSGISKGKGFQGAVKRWGFANRGEAHGIKHDLRTVGSVGSAYPQRVWKGKKMPGRMGGKKVTVRNLEIKKIDPENNLLAVKGAVPGRKGTLLEIRG